MLSPSWLPFSPLHGDDDDMDVDDPEVLPPITLPPPGAVLLQVTPKIAHITHTPPPPSPIQASIHSTSQVSPSKRLRKLIKLDSIQNTLASRPAEPKFYFQDLVPFTKEHLEEQHALSHLILFHQPLQPTQELPQPNPYSGPVAPSQPPRTFGYV